MTELVPVNRNVLQTSSAGYPACQRYSSSTNTNHKSPTRSLVVPCQTSAALRDLCKILRLQGTRRLLREEPEASARNDQFAIRSTSQPPPVCLLRQCARHRRPLPDPNR